MKLAVNKLTKKIQKLKSKSSQCSHLNVSAGIDDDKTREASTMTMPSVDPSLNVHRLKSDRDYFEREYLKLVENQRHDIELEKLRSRLREKDLEIAKLHRGQHVHRVPVSNDACCGPMAACTCRSMRTGLSHRRDNEKHCSHECICKRDKSSVHGGCNKITQQEHEIERLKQTINELEATKRTLETLHEPNKAKIRHLESEMTHQKIRNKELKEELDRMRASHDQLKYVTLSH